MEIKIPKCMSTQHPDNVTTPFFSESPEIGGDDEITEAYYAFSHLGCDEQMWDCEGKEVDNFVVKKLLTRYDSFFSENVLGKDVFITLRVPNPLFERDEAKILIETLESIPRSYDTARIFYQKDIAPIFEIILPLTTSATCLNRIYWYYRDFVYGKQYIKFRNDDCTIAEWIGDFNPSDIHIIPLFEDWDHILIADQIVKEFLRDKDFKYIRVFFARSDPAMNYGMISAVLLNKIALQRMYKLSEEIGVEIYPIIGVGSAPFRGNMKPSTVERILKEYPSAHTFTIQSAFKYDNSPDEVREAIKKIRSRSKGLPHMVDEERALEIMKKYTQAYRGHIKNLANLINEVAKYVPKRRRRKLHVGLFGYPREVEGIKLPRVITFTAALYSIGIPPEVLGLEVLDKEDIRFLKTVYVNFEEDIFDALSYLDIENNYLPEEIRKSVHKLDFSSFNIEHIKISRKIIEFLKDGKYDNVQEEVLRAAYLRKFLG
ncbi:MAG: phosphoenolpyruvate carboxylase [Dictyoglomus sp.]|nr:phosphoenolpyruvate carboxylase [Dictyoglomus sp.]MDW8189014.1 phosphoenolpyruvate carboxylase [Dictyoglomus sp.]